MIVPETAPEANELEAVVAAIDSQSCVFTEGLKVLLEHSSIAFEVLELLDSLNPPAVAIP